MNAAEIDPSMARGSKRKRGGQLVASPERQYGYDSDSSVQSGPDGASSDESDIPTPLTPVSPQPSLGYPSNAIKKFVCDYHGCGKAFNRPAKLEQHVRSHTNTRPFVCTEGSCTKAFMRQQHLQQHIKSAHTNVRDHQCTWQDCSKAFTTATRLKRHLATHENRQRFACLHEDCGQEFRKRSTLQTHITKVHEHRKPFTCAFLDDDGRKCDAGFDTADRLRNHQGRMHQVKRYSCSICDLAIASNESLGSQPAPMFSTYHGLQQHIAAEHPPVCLECGLQCVTQVSLKSHIEVRHGGIGLDKRKIYACTAPGCDSRFTKRGNLDVHVQTVHGNRRFVCSSSLGRNPKFVEEWDGTNACGGAFKSKVRLLDHIRAAHTGVDGRAPTGKSKREYRARKKLVARLTGSNYVERNQASHAASPSAEASHLAQDLGHDMEATASAEFDDTWLNNGMDQDLLGEDNADGENFWLGAAEHFDGVDPSDSWPQEEREMRRLIHDELDPEAAGVMDPSFESIESMLGLNAF